MRGQIVVSPSGEEIVLADIGITELLDNAFVRVWDVSLEPGETHPWHLHHNPYVVLSLHGSPCRMDWLDGSEPRFLNEYHGGAVYRPISPVHRLTNIGDRFYQNRLIELKELGELLPEPAEVGEGARSVEGERPGPRLPDGRLPVIDHPHVRVWIAGTGDVLDLTDRPHVLAGTAAQGVVFHPGGPVSLPGPGEWFVVELAY